MSVDDEDRLLTQNAGFDLCRTTGRITAIIGITAVPAFPGRRTANRRRVRPVQGRLTTAAPSYGIAPKLSR
jgi:hypothetical protein